MKDDKLQILDRITGCLVGGALGDALGAPLENMSRSQATSTFDKRGWADGPLKVTSNTQLTLFTAEGMIRASQRFKDRGLCSIRDVLELAYHRWLHTQGISAAIPFGRGWLVDCVGLHEKRGSSATLKAALKSGPKADSAGNGAITRIGPVGLTTLNVQEVAAEVAAISHPHEEAQQAAADFAVILQRVVLGDSAEMAIRSNISFSKHYHYAACVSGKNSEEGQSAPTVSARQALLCAISSAAVANYPPPLDFWRGLRHAVCNGGCSDAVGSLTGQLLGCQLGYSGLPQELVGRLELHLELRLVARDLWLEYFDGWAELYPPN